MIICKMAARMHERDVQIFHITQESKNKQSFNIFSTLLNLAAMFYNQNRSDALLQDRHKIFSPFEAHLLFLLIFLIS